jgi:hypothetical protein
VKVDLGARKALLAQQDLYRPEVSGAFQHRGCERVSYRMRTSLEVDTGLVAQLFDHPLNGADGEPLVLLGHEERGVVADGKAASPVECQQLGDGFLG